MSGPADRPAIVITGPAANDNPPSPAIALVSAELLRVACPENAYHVLAGWVAPLRAAMERFGIDTFREVAAFLAQAAHESRGFTDLQEDLSYRAERLCQVWPTRFRTIAAARPFAHNPEKLANFVYANRLGNGPPESGDGFRYRGAGLFQTTGKRNHHALGAAVGLPAERVPAYLRTPEGAAMGAGFFWHENGLDRFATTPGVEDETGAINGGQHGLADRRARFDRTIAAMLKLERGALL